MTALRFRPQLVALAAFIVTLAALAVGLFIIDRSGEVVLARQQAAIARSASDYFVAFAGQEGVAALSRALNQRERAGSPDGFRYALVEPDGRVDAGADVIGELDAPDAGWRTVAQDDAKAPRYWRVLATPMAGGKTLVVAEDLSVRRAFRAALLRGSAGALLLGLVAVVGLSLLLNSLLLRRAESIAAAADRIAAGDLTARAAVRPNGDVFDHLGGAVNAMLARIEELMTGMRAVTDSVAHDLRSPLMRMQGALAAAGSPDATEAERNDAIWRAHGEAEGALATLSALIDIANAESGLSRDHLRPIDIGAVALEMGELFAPALEDAGQTLAVDVPDEPLVAPAHELLLRQALGNLLHNAAIHAGPGAAVILSVRPQREGGGDGEAAVRIVVADNGCGVPDEHLGRVQQRFVRLDEARTRPGSGLGLSIAAACARLHGGRLDLASNAPGLRATIDLRAYI